MCFLTCASNIELSTSAFHQKVKVTSLTSRNFIVGRRQFSRLNPRCFDEVLEDMATKKGIQSIFFLLLCYSSCVWTATAPLIIATYPTDPFVIVDSNTSLRGFSIDLWDNIAKNMEDPIDYRYLVVDSLAALLNAVTNGSIIANASIDSISITTQRASIMDFSQPMLDSGLQIMTYKSTKVAEGSRTLLILQVLFSRLFWEIIGVFFIFIIVFTHLFYLVEKKAKGEEASVRASYMRGGFEDSIWWAASILFTSGSDLMPMTILGRLLTVVGFLASCVLVAILQAAITAQLTVSSLQQTDGIQNINDLVGLNVGVESSSTSDIYLSRIGGINLIRFNTSADMLDAFANKKLGLSAVFGDYPVFQYYVANAGANIGEIVGPIYQPQQYGIAFPTGSPLRREVDIAILSLQESGTFQQLHDKWFAGISDDSGGDINVLDPDNLTLAITWGLVALSALFVIIIMSIRYHRTLKKQKKKGDIPLEPTDNWEAVTKEITELQEHLQALTERLQKVREMSLQAKKKEGTYY